MTSLISDYKVSRPLGKGLQGFVLLAHHAMTNEKVALKLPPSFNHEDPLGIERKKGLIEMKAYLKEIKALRRLNHENIIKLKKVISGEGLSVGMVLEYAKHGDMYSIITAHGRFSEALAKKLFGQLACAVRECHRNKIFHRDIKLENILLTDNFIVKLCDFGLSSIMKGDDTILRDVCGTKSYMSPEVAQRLPHEGGPADIWSMGVVLFTFIAGFPPYQEPTSKDWWFGCLEAGNYERFWASHRKHASFSDAAVSLLSKMLSVDPEQRISLNGIFQHSWMLDQCQINERHEYEEEIMKQLLNDTP